MKCNTFAGVLLSVLLLTGMPVLSAAADTANNKSTDGNFSCTILEDGTAAVYCENPQLERAVIPEVIGGYTITALADGCFSQNTALTEVVFPSGLTAIGEGAFSGCENLADLTLPDTLTEIGSNAFHGCSALTEISIPASVEHIGVYAFDTTENIAEFIVDDANPAYSDLDGVLFDKTAATLIKYPEARPDTAYTVPASCTAIADWGFIGTQSLEQVNLGNVTSIGEDAFYYCVNLRSIVIPEGVTELVGGAFCYCTSLESITLPSTLKRIGENCFYSCTALKELTLPEGLEAIGASAFFHCTSLKSLNVPKSVITVTAYCMGYCYSEEAQGSVVQDDFTLYVTRGTPGFTYASSNDIPYKIQLGNTPYYLLIGAAAIIIIALIAGIVVVVKKRRA